MRNKLKFIFCTFFIVFFACGNKDEGAISYINEARLLYSQNEFDKARQIIDSLHTHYPKAYEQRKAGMALLDTIRRAENQYIISKSDSLIGLYSPELEKMKSSFLFRRNRQYQETGEYIPKESASDVLTYTTLRSGVLEDGQLFLESVFLGQQKHSKIKVTSKDGSFLESLPVTDDGLNYRFSNMEKNYEIIRFAGKAENGIGKYIHVYKGQPLQLTLEGGGGKYSYTLSQTIKSAVSKSFQLSTMILQLDSLKKLREEAQFKIYYLDNKKGEEAKEPS